MGRKHDIINNFIKCIDDNYEEFDQVILSSLFHQLLLFFNANHIKIYFGRR